MLLLLRGVTETHFSTSQTYAPLPKLPVPDPKKTLKHFLQFAEPLQTPKEFEQTKLVVKEFAQKELPALQRLLEQRASKLNNWLTPWWLDVAYLQARTPLTVVTSPGLTFPVFPCTGKDSQVEHAAKMTQAATEFYLKVMRCIEDALFVVCIDQESEPPKGYTERDEHARQILHGGGAQVNSGNRWFDKTLQVIAGKNGYCGICYEHTPAEGPPVAALMEYICDKFDSKQFNDDSTAPEEQVKRLDFDLNDAQKAQVERSGKKMDRVADDVDVVSYTFKRYGKNFPKSMKISPDSWIQMAFQLAFYRIHSALPPTYETATLRKFSEGRTENIRSPNALAEVFVKK
ncbi:Choline/Carnitine O-acyltransferase, partial [Ancylostoma duodenale]